MPRPRIGGGIKENASPSFKALIFWLISALISEALRSRWSNGLSGKNTTPVLEVLVNCSAFKPGNAMACSTPSVFMAMSTTSLSSSSVRCKDAPSGSFTPAIR